MSSHEKKAEALFKFLRDSRMKQQNRTKGHFKQATDKYQH
jgi:hypothetical protein